MWDETQCREWAALGHVRADEYGIDYYDCLRAFDAPNAATHVSLWVNAVAAGRRAGLVPSKDRQDFIKT